MKKGIQLAKMAFTLGVQPRQHCSRPVDEYGWRQQGEESSAGCAMPQVDSYSTKESDKVCVKKDNIPDTIA